uniref:Uncharacterized protein n=1 Tax=Callorhinchus milii TaxID=7868 RepID=A0A4W3JNM6_CALMI
MNYLKDQLGIKPPDTVDLCNEWGNLKLLFLLKDQYENIGNIFELRENCYACRIQRIPPEMAYKAFIPLIDDAADNMLENLQQQCEELEHIRQEEVLGEERKQLLEATISSTVRALPDSGEWAYRQIIHPSPTSATPNTALGWVPEHQQQMAFTLHGAFHIGKTSRISTRAGG